MSAHLLPEESTAIERKGKGGRRKVGRRGGCQRTEGGWGSVMFRGLVGSKSYLKDPLIGSVLPWINCRRGIKTPHQAHEQGLRLLCVGLGGGLRKPAGAF